MSQAVRDLGPASVLAQQLKLAEGRKLPHALIEAARQVGGARIVTVHASWLGTTASITNGPHHLSGQWEGSGLPPTGRRRVFSSYDERQVP